MLGLDEISHLLEEPFRLMPLYHLSKNSMKDVADAFVCMPPPLPLLDDDTEEEDKYDFESDNLKSFLEDNVDDNSPYNQVVPAYW